ncbi:hypothetical protein Zmor_017832 [Zophobas morio]|uniref:CRAL-TRIO domain-containing protein n=1 Tax=Zophobas morio TaxID=2755281 RepID=A0AA38I5U3_9CUCU|nr:hypothetical protein Zmor_017832 [Zophobas morio]
MDLISADVESQYARDKNLKKGDIEALLEWANKQPHLPKINELQAILFLHSCYYRNEAAKVTIDNFFTVKTTSDLFRNRDPLSAPVQNATSATLCTRLSKKTPKGYIVYLFKLIDTNPSNFNFENIVRYADMVNTLERYQYGISTGLVILLDMTGWSLGHTARLGPLALKTFFFYLQEAVPVRLKEIHFHNAGPFINTLMNLFKPLLNKATAEKISIHQSLDSLTKFIPLECLPEDYGGSEQSIFALHAKIKKDLLENKALYEWEETLILDEKKRQSGKSKTIDTYGADGTFKKLELD